MGESPELIIYITSQFSLVLFLYAYLFMPLCSCISSRRTLRSRLFRPSRPRARGTLEEVGQKWCNTNLGDCSGQEGGVAPPTAKTWLMARVLNTHLHNSLLLTPNSHPFPSLPFPRRPPLTLFPHLLLLSTRHPPPSTLRQTLSGHFLQGYDGPHLGPPSRDPGPGPERRRRRLLHQ